MRNLISIVETGNGGIKVVVTDAGSKIFGLRTRDRRDNFVRTLLRLGGIIVPNREDGILNPIYIYSMRGVSNDGFTAIVSLR